MPIRHRMKLEPDSFERLKSGVKRFEFRLNDEKRKALTVGERVEFAKRPELETSVIVEITSLNIFPAFVDLYDQFPAAVAGRTKAEFLETMRKHYTADEELKYGVVAIGVKLV